MIKHETYTELIQWHKAIEFFEYDLAIDWAIKYIENGLETENILIVASFSKPVDSYEIKPYISGAIKELNLEEKYDEYSVMANIHCHTAMILEDYDTRQNLSKLYNLCLHNNFELGLYPFFSLYHAWIDLEEIGDNYYYKGATLKNIDSKLKMEAQKWIDIYIEGEKIRETTAEIPLNTMQKRNKKKRNKPFWNSFWNFLNTK